MYTSINIPDKDPRKCVQVEEYFHTPLAKAPHKHQVLTLRYSLFYFSRHAITAVHSGQCPLELLRSHILGKAPVSAPDSSYLSGAADGTAVLALPILVEVALRKYQTLG